MNIHNVCWVTSERNISFRESIMRSQVTQCNYVVFGISLYIKSPDVNQKGFPKKHL